MTDATHGVTTGAVARRLGVSPTTLRSWDQRYGIGPAARENGRHRRWSPEDIAVLEAMCRLTTSGVPPAEAARVARTRAGQVPSPSEAPGVAVPARAPGSGNGLPLGEVHREFRGLARAAVRLDSPTMDQLLRELVAAHGLVTSWEEVMAPTLHAVGRKWESSGDRYVEVEHLLSWHISTTLRQLAGAARPHPADSPPVLLACVPGEQHTLSLEALAAGLAEHGLPFRMFGAAVPAEALDAAVRRLGPTAVVLWSQSRSTASHALARHVADTSFGVRGARAHPLVLLGGPGWAGRAVAPGMLRPMGLREALSVLSQR
ncbi:Transcriptional regulator [Streptomyces venezuelae]|uniref:MerR family transcriptional regulator n=1 Tax=Streptomyces gardneri TaxID=66892 RepID=UPI0006BCF3B0|nr:MerR family transcriptional regulator [Streptomyces gardneri]ALO13365.1 Transcriptional regulator [Streptomyces venezuelae]QPK50014.1 MerR family transcriptional regulator [Streptomyces gardneri]WRK41588.1 MerR family transcriptional regulator [Streptomyces venezuelae]CUM35929.1 transcriptional regulator [Streptomyces venezuelae]